MRKTRNTGYMEQYRLVAHRGLHDGNRTIPENSLPAFARAVEKGRAIELDVHLTADNQLVVFHDEQLKRMTGVPGVVEQWRLSDLRQLRLMGTEYGIPTLDEALDLVAGRVPLLLEIKNFITANVGRLEKRLIARLDRYPGQVILESFNPEVLVWLHRRAPRYIRGQLGNYLDENKGFSFYSGHLMFNPLAKPDFIAFDVHKIDYRLRQACKKRGVPLFGWTVRTEEDLKRARQLCDGVIYELLDL